MLVEVATATQARKQASKHAGVCSKQKEPRDETK